ncbi:MAG: hypothetical protein KME31_37115 [Tolypothrix carrinoi HA7290-LM1]|jgi:hypothetical protein|nr:hypothetical protein [Tolypothrix carrinoi HA7290-LM1]
MFICQKNGGKLFCALTIYIVTLKPPSRVPKISGITELINCNITKLGNWAMGNGHWAMGIGQWAMGIKNA